MHDNKYWDRWYVFLKIILPSLIFICLEDRNKLWMDKAYYYYIITKHLIYKYFSNIEIKYIFADMK